MAKTKGIIVELGGDASGLNKAISSVSKEARDTQSELKKIERLLKMDPGNTTLLKQKQELLNESISKTEDVITALKDAKDRADADMANGTEINEKAYRELERQIEANEITLKNTRKEADKVAEALNSIDSDELRDVARAADDAEEALEDAKKEAADFGDVLKANMISDAASNIVDSLKDVAEETKEYRKIMGSLEVSSEAAGYTTEQTSEAYRRLYGVLADDQSAATTLANLQALELNQEDLLALIDNVIGGWAKYGDSIPIDGLAEAVNETIRAGQVTGTFADILNWGAKEGETYGVKLKENIEFTKLTEKQLKKLSGAQREAYESTKEQYDSIEDWNNAVLDAATAEDIFNLALQQCATETERVNLVMQAMADQGLSSMAQKWKENNQEIVEANLVQETFTKRLAYLGERAQPVFTALTDGSSLLLSTLLDLAEGVDLDPIVNAIEATFEAMDKLIYFVVENGEIFLSVLGGIGAGLAALKLTEFTKTLSAVFNGTTALAQAFPVLGSAISLLTNPIFIVTAAVIAFTAIIATKGDEIQGALQRVNDFLNGVFATDWTNVFGPVLGNALNAFFANLENIWNAVLQIFNGVIDFVRGVFTGDWERAWSGIVQIFGGIFDGIYALAAVPINGIIGLINSAIDGINWLISNINRIPGVSIGNVGRIPMLADGGTVWSGSAIVGEAGPELLTVSGGKAVVQPLSANTGRIEGLLGDINSQLAGGSGMEIPFVVQVNLDSKVVGESAVQYIRRSDRGNGK